MRLRNIPGSREVIADSPYVIHKKIKKIITIKVTIIL